MNRRIVDRPPMILVQGSCRDLEKERLKIMDFIRTLEMGAHEESKCECSAGGRALGWDFFYIYFDPAFVEKLLDLYPDIQKQEANDIEHCFVIWLNKQMKKGRAGISFKAKRRAARSNKGLPP